MESVQEFVDKLTDEQIAEVYKYYDSGSYDHLMAFTHKEMPRKDNSLRRRILAEYLYDVIQENSNDSLIFSNIIQQKQEFGKFRYQIQNQCFGEPLIHRLNQITRTPVFGKSPIAKEMELKRFKENLREFRELLQETFETKKRGYITSDEVAKNDYKVKEVITIIDELL